jgi:hypothetical protein
MSSWVGSCISGSKLASVLLSESWYTFSNYVQNILRFFAFCAKVYHPFVLRVLIKVFKSADRTLNDKNMFLKNAGFQKGSKNFYVKFK